MKKCRRKRVSNRLTFELVQPSEFEDYYYNIVCDGEVNGSIDYDGFEWSLAWLYVDYVFNRNELIQIANKLLKLNAATKADKLFGFL